MNVKSAQLLEGRVLAKSIQDEIAKALQGLTKNRKPMPQLISVQVGQNSSAEWYLSQQEKLAAKLGIRFQKKNVETGTDSRSLEHLVRELSQNPEITGIFITMPLPKGFNSDSILFCLDPKKDVEGIHPANLGLMVLRKTHLIPPTAFAAFKLIESTGVSLRGKRAAIAGQSAIVGRPLQLLLGEQRVTTTVCNTGTSNQDLEKIVSESDIVIGCAGQPGLIKGEWIKDGAIVIDVGTTEVAGKLAGDVEFEKAKGKAQFITPVPGGVGPLTVTMLMQNLMKAYEWQQGMDF